MANAVTWFEIIGKDGPKLREFYSSLFGWKFHVAQEMDYGMMEAGAGGIGGGIGSGSGNMPSYVAIYVQVEDINAALKEAESLGGKTLMPRTVVPNQVIFALFSDPEGHLVGLTEGM